MYTVLNFIGVIFLIVFSLIAHEMGHWVVLTRLKVPVLEWWAGLGPAIFKMGKFRIGMLPIGASIYPDPEKFAALTPRERMAVALGGPVGSAVYGMALLLGSMQLAEGHKGLMGMETLALANFTIALFNMLPIPPMDGFQLLDAICEQIGRPLSEKAKSFSYRLGNGLVYGLGFFLLASILFV
jgi:membrane-associated protease RseP (regulator of RpoE activity)